MPTHEPGWYEQTLDHLLEQGVRSVQLCQEEGYPDGRGRASLESDPRLVVCLSGRARYRIIRRREPVDLQVNPGEAVYVAKNRWINNVSLSRYVSIGIVYHHMFTRHLRIAHEPSKMSQAVIGPSDWRHAAPLTMSTGRSLCDALDHADVADEKDPYVVRVFEALLLASRRLLTERCTLGSDHALSGGKAFATWQAASRFVIEHCDQPISRDDVARSLDIHPNHVSRLFAQYSGESYSAYLHRVRLDRAQDLLKNPQLNVSQIAELCGFGDPNYFSRLFRRQFGITPSQMRQTLG